MNTNQETLRRKITAIFKMVLAVSAVSVGGQVALGQNLIKNGDFSNGLSDWKTVGDVTVEMNQAILKDTGADPLLYQAVAANGYAYELRFDVDLAGLSDRAGSGEFDSVSLVLYEGTDPNNLTPDNASEKRILIRGNASGLTALVEKAQIAPNPVLGLGYLSVVVEFTSDFSAVAPGTELFNLNGNIDSEIRISNVRLVQVDRGRLSNISNRGAVGTGPNRMIASFVLSGPEKKSVVVRGAGPWLADLGVPGTLEDPSIELKNFATGAVISSNNDWEVGNDKTELIAAMTKVGAWGLPFKDGSKDSGLFQNEGGGLEDGQYSVIIAGLGPNPTGIAIAEIYDYDVFEDGTTELVNISNRGNTAKGSGAQIPGFVITGDRGRVVLIRVVGPSLAAFVPGTLDDPLLILGQSIDGQNFEIARNDDYYLADNADQIVATASRVGAFGLLPNEKDSAILIGLEPGVYTAQAQVKTDTDSGVVLVEVYVVADNTRPAAATHVVFVSTSGTTTLPMDVILHPDQDGEGDILSVASHGQPGHGSVELNDDDELDFTNEIGFVGQTIFSYTLTDGEFESAPGTIGLNVAPPGARIWTGGSSGNFSDPANWASGEVPGPTADVWIVPQGEAVITLNQDTQLKSLRVGGIGSDVTFKNSYRHLVTTGSTIVGYGSTYELSGGSIDTGDNFVINGKLKWTGGQMKGGATTIIEVGAVAELSSGQLVLADGRDFLNRGKVIQSGNSYLYSIGGSDSMITNALAAQWDVTSTSSRFAYTDTNSSLLFNNAGDLYKSATSGAVIYGYSNGSSSFTNQATGRVMIEGGSLNFQGAGLGSHSGELMIADSAEALFTYGTHTFNSGAVISDTGTLHVSTNASVTIASANILESLKISGNGTLNHSGTLTVGTFDQANGKLKSDDSLVVTEKLTWAGGTHDGEGTTILENGGTGTLLTTTLTLNGNRAFTNHGEITQQGNALLYPQGGSQSVVTNADDGIWNLNLGNNRNAAYPDNSSRLDFDNAGVLNKQNNLHTYNMGGSQGTSNFSNTGTINVPSGVLQFDGSGIGSHDGEFVISSGAEVKLNRGTHTFGEDALISDTGTLHIAGVAATSMPNAHTLESLKISAGTLSADEAITAVTFVQSGGTFVSSADLIVTDTLTVTGGTQNGAGVTILDAEGEGTISGARWLFTGSRGFTNRGTLTMSGSTSFYASGGGQTTITNAQDANLTSNLANGQYIVYSNDGSTTTSLVNEGTLTKANLVGINYIGYSSHVTNFTNASTGTVNVEGGTLQFWGGGSSAHSGTLTIAANAEVYFQVGTHNFLSGATVTDSGTLHVGSSNVSVAEALTIPNLKLSGSQGGLTAGGDLTVETYEQTHGTLTGSSDMTVTDSFMWSAGFQTGTGTTIIGSETTAVLGSTTLYLRGNRQFLNNGTLTQNAGAALYADQSSQASVTNAAGGTWNVNTNNNTRFAYNTNDSAMTFTNAGTLNKTNSGTTFFGTNGGTSTFVNAATGEINLSGGIFWFDGSGPGTHQGALNVSELAAVSFRYGAHSFTAGATISSAATLVLENNAATTVSFAQAVSFDTLQMKNGTVTNSVDIAVNSFTQNNGTVTGNANLTVAETASLTGGAQTGSGTMIFDTGATVNHTGLIYLESGRKIENRGTYQLSGNGYYSARGGLGASTVTNGSGASWTITSTRLVNNDSSSSINFINDGTLTKTSTNTTQFGAGSGQSSFTNNATFEVQAGAFQFNGTATGNFVGGSTARLTTNGGTAKVIDGTGTINFGGTLEVLLAVGFLPSNGQTITLIDFGKDKGTGTFATHTPPAGYSSISPTYNYSSNPGNLEITFNQ